jgi:hypothetical protein
VKWLSLLVLVIGVQGLGQAQTQVQGPGQAQPSANEDLFKTWLPAAGPEPKNARAWALSEMRKYDEAEKAREQRWGYGFVWTRGVSYAFYGTDGAQTATIKEDGSVDLVNLTMEDLVLMLYANQLDRQMEQQAAVDDEERARAEMKKDQPPGQLRLGSEVWSVDTEPDWSHGYLAGDTNCALRRVRLLNDDKEMRADSLHEALHVATGCSDRPNVHHAISLAAPRLLDLMRQSPALVAWWMKGVPGFKYEAPAASVHRADCVEGSGDKLCLAAGAGTNFVMVQARPGEAGCSTPDRPTWAWLADVACLPAAAPSLDPIAARVGLADPGGGRAW